MVQNPKNNGHYLAITTPSSLSTINPPFHTDKVQKTNCLVVNETPSIEANKATGVDTSVGEDIGKGMVDKPMVRQISDHQHLFLRD